MTPNIAERLGIRVRRGVLVQEVAGDGFAEEINIQVGDVILSVDDQRIDDLADFQAAMEAFDPDQSVSFQIQRGRARHTISVE